jgi:Flp pilus assembly protein TadG
MVRSMPAPFTSQFAKEENGGAAIELAIIAPLLVVLFLNVVDFSRMIWDSMETDFSAQMGTRAAYQTCVAGMIPATSNCAGFNAAVSNAIQETSLGAGVTLASGSPSENYYCLSGTTLQWVGSYSSPPNPFNCSSVGEPNVTPSDYIQVTVNYNYTPISGLSLLSAFTLTSSSFQRL